MIFRKYERIIDMLQEEIYSPDFYVAKRLCNDIEIRGNTQGRHV